MGIAEIIIIVVCVAVVLAVGVSIVVAKLKGKPSCCSDCSGCPHAKACAGKSGQTDCCCDTSSTQNKYCDDTTTTTSECPYCSGRSENSDNQNTGE